MGVDYVVNQDCPPKDRHGVDVLVDMLKSRAGVTAVVESMRASGDDRPLSELTITRVLLRPEGDTETSVTMEEMLAKSAPLDTEAKNCSSCPADRGAKGFGCTGYINYPISEQTEQWLMARLPDDLASPTMFMLKAAITDFDYSGAPSKRMRDAGEIFFEARKPQTREWGKKRLFRGRDLTITSDQMFQMMFHVGTVDPMHAALLCAFVGMVPIESLTDEDALLRATLPEVDDASTGQLRAFFQTLAYAAAHGHSVSLSA